MNKTFKILISHSLTLLFFCVNLDAQAQMQDPENYLVLYSGDTLHGDIDYVNNRGINPKYRKKIRLIPNKEKKQKFKRKDVAAFSINSIRYEGFWLSKSTGVFSLFSPNYVMDNTHGEQHFLRVVSSGKLTHYQLEWWEQGDSGISWMDLFLKEGDTQFIRATQGVLGLKRNVLADYFSDCPELAELIKQKKIHKVAQVADFYNAECGFKHIN